jgi:microcystin-dependent protein
MNAYTPFLGQIELFGYNFVTGNWALCNGQLLLIADHNALFSLIGTTYGGDGQTTFAVPDLRGRVAVGVGTGAGLSAVTLGQTNGAETATMLTANLPAHSHSLAAQSGIGSTSVPGTTVALAQVAEDDGTPARSYSSAAADTTLSSASIGNTGGGQPMSIRNPYLGLQYAISLQGIYPSAV